MLRNDLEMDVLVARIECVALRDKLRRMDGGAPGRADVRSRFERAKATLAMANSAAHAGHVTVPILPYPTHDLQTPFYVRVMAMLADYESSPAQPSVTTICRFPGCSARGHVHRQTETAPPAESAAP